jgi:hypothetical protein
VPSGVERQPTPDDQLVPIMGYMNMVASHDASTVEQWATDDYLQHGPFGANVTRDEFEAGNRDIVWKALPDISIRLEPLLADGETGRRARTRTGNAHWVRPARRPRFRQERHLHRNAHLQDA